MGDRGGHKNIYPRRNADRGNEGYRRHPQDIAEIARLQQRARDLELRREDRSDEYLFARRFASRGNDTSIFYSHARGEDQPSIRRTADRGSGGVGPDPRDIKIKRLRQRVCDLETQQQIELRQRVRDLELQREMHKAETESSTVVRDEGGDGEQQPFSRHPYRFSEPTYPNFPLEDGPRFDKDEMDFDNEEFLVVQAVLNGEYDDESVLKFGNVESDDDLGTVIWDESEDDSGNGVWDESDYEEDARNEGQKTVDGTRVLKEVDGDWRGFDTCWSTESVKLRGKYGDNLASTICTLEGGGPTVVKSVKGAEDGSQSAYAFVPYVTADESLIQLGRDLIIPINMEFQNGIDNEVIKRSSAIYDMGNNYDDLNFANVSDDRCGNLHREPTSSLNEKENSKDKRIIVVHDVLASTTKNLECINDIPRGPLMHIEFLVENDSSHVGDVEILPKCLYYLKPQHMLHEKNDSYSLSLNGIRKIFYMGMQNIRPMEANFNTKVGLVGIDNIGSFGVTHSRQKSNLSFDPGGTSLESGGWVVTIISRILVDVLSVFIDKDQLGDNDVDMISVHENFTCGSYHPNESQLKPNALFDAGGTGSKPNELTRDVELYRHIVITVQQNRVDVPFDPGGFGYGDKTRGRVFFEEGENDAVGPSNPGPSCVPGQQVQFEKQAQSKGWIRPDGDV